jgi:hypothetical protein
MQSFSHSQLKTIIKLEASGGITPKEIYKRAALAKIQNSDTYVSAAVMHLIAGGFLVSLAGQVVMPIMAFSWLYTWYKSYTDRQHSIRQINGGNIADYLDEDDRANFEEDMKEEPIAPPETFTPRTKVETEPQASVTQNTAGQNRGLQIVDLPRAMGQDLHPTIISAKPRVGKGMVIQAAWKHAKKAHPGITVWVIDPKPHKTEQAYWSGVDRYWGQMVEDFPQNDEAIATELTAFIHEWRAQGNRPTLLIIDELVKLEAVFPKWYKDFLISTMKVEASSGETDQRFLWVIAQSPQVKDLGLTGGSRAVFDFLTLQRADSIDHAERVKASIDAIKSIPTTEQFASVPSGVAFWHSRVNRWGGVPLIEVPKSATVAAHAVKVAVAKDETEADDGKAIKPDLSAKDIMMQASMLAEWIEAHPDTPKAKLYSSYNAYNKGFTRPQFRYLLNKVED